MASEIPIWLNEKGVVNEVVFCNMFVEQMPLKYIKKSVMQTEIGMARPMMIVLLNERKNTSNTKMAKSAP